NLVITQGQETRKISKAFLVLKPVRLIIANFYGNDPALAAEQGFDDHIEGSANAIAAQTHDKDPADVLVVRISSTTQTPNPKKGDIDALSQLKDYALKSKKDGGLGIQKGSVISVDTLGHGSRAKEFSVSSLFVSALDQENPNNIMKVSLEPPPADIANGTLEDSVYAGYFTDLMANTRRVAFNLWHCFPGSKVGLQKSQVERLAEAFGILKKKVVVQGPIGLCDFPDDTEITIHPDGSTEVKATGYASPLFDEEGIATAQTP
ncbi:MAG: hypothetical protein HYU36_24980, partial [Planctomycetes bacterium]|nr:hypothetical protein [Planctomycetota bacterium]